MSSFVSTSRTHQRTPGIQTAGQLLKELHGELLISKQKLERAKGIELVREYSTVPIWFARPNSPKSESLHRLSP